MQDTETACFGWLHEPPGAVARGAENIWNGIALKPWRCQSLLVWAEPSASIRQILVGNVAQLAIPVPTAMFDRELVLGISDAILLLEEAYESPSFLAGVRCNAALKLSPRVDVITASPGVAITVRWTGQIRALLLVGDQIP